MEPLPPFRSQVDSRTKLPTKTVLESKFVDRNQCWDFPDSADVGCQTLSRVHWIRRATLLVNSRSATVSNDLELLHSLRCGTANLWMLYYELLKVSCEVCCRERDVLARCCFDVSCVDLTVIRHGDLILNTGCWHTDRQVTRECELITDRCHVGTNQHWTCDIRT